MKKFKVGDKVRIKKGLIAGAKDGGHISTHMASLGGKIFPIKAQLTGVQYDWEVEGCLWREDWLESVRPETIADKITDLQATMKADEEAYMAKREANQKALDALLALPPSAGDVYWNPKTGTHTKCTIKAVVDGKLWYETFGGGYIQPVDYFATIGYVRYVP